MHPLSVLPSQSPTPESHPTCLQARVTQRPNCLDTYGHLHLRLRLSPTVEWRRRRTRRCELGISPLRVARLMEHRRSLFLQPSIRHQLTLQDLHGAGASRAASRVCLRHSFRWYSLCSPAKGWPGWVLVSWSSGCLCACFALPSVVRH